MAYKVCVLIHTINSDKCGLISIWRRAERLNFLKTSGTWRLLALAQEMRAYINLSLGGLDFYISSYALDEGCGALREGKTHYIATSKVPKLRESLAQKTCGGHRLSYDSTCEVLVAIRGTQAIFIALMRLLNEADGVLITDLRFVAYEPCVLLAVGPPICVLLNEDNDFRPSINGVTSLITDKSHVMVLNQPNNATGSVLSYGDGTEMSEIPVEHDLTVISDEA